MNRAGVYRIEFNTEAVVTSTGSILYILFAHRNGVRGPLAIRFVSADSVVGETQQAIVHLIAIAPFDVGDSFDCAHPDVTLSAALG